MSAWAESVAKGDVAEGWCYSCSKDAVPVNDDWLCEPCAAERDACPVWHAIQRVEHGEVTVRIRRDLEPSPCHCDGYVETSDGWVFAIFYDGTPPGDFDYIDGATDPQGKKWEIEMPDEPRPAFPIPWSVWQFRPANDEGDRRWWPEDGR